METTKPLFSVKPAKNCGDVTVRGVTLSKAVALKTLPGTTGYVVSSFLPPAWHDWFDETYKEFLAIGGNADITENDISAGYLARSEDDFASPFWDVGKQYCGLTSLKSNVGFRCFSKKELGPSGELLEDMEVHAFLVKDQSISASEVEFTTYQAIKDSAKFDNKSPMIPRRHHEDKNTAVFYLRKGVTSRRLYCGKTSIDTDGTDLNNALL
jgi:hypothetical protein